MDGLFRSLRIIEIPHIECKDFTDILKENNTLRRVRSVNVLPTVFRVSACRRKRPTHRSVR